MNRMGLGLAIGAGYLLGRTKKLKFAVAVGSMVAGKKLNLTPKGVAELVSGQLQNNPQFKEIGDQLRTDLRGVGKAASGALVERQMGALADRLHGRTAQVRDELSGVASRAPGAGSDDSRDSEASEDSEQDEYDEHDEYDEYDEHEEPEQREEAEEPDEAGERRREEPRERRAPRRERPAGKAPAEARKTARKAPVKKSAAKAPAKKAAAKRTQPAKKAAAKKTSRARQPKGGGER
ncbi:DNA primase [Streptomyces sp. CoH17]|uniref:DNA primase n=1 Tax=Streptomyces sp. CoH17 TaxID=2992806 RepID=UPI00226EB9F3|nr:DNA primase [Streptomyces sp. CoH17]